MLHQAEEFLFRVHYTLTSVNCIEHLSKDVLAADPNAAAVAVAKQLKPSTIAISKVKRVKS